MAKELFIVSQFSPATGCIYSIVIKRTMAHSFCEHCSLLTLYTLALGMLMRFLYVIYKCL